MKAINLLLGCWILLGLVGCSTLGRRAVLPGSYLKHPDCVVAPSSQYELVTLHTSSGTKIIAQYGEALSDSGESLVEVTTRPTVIFFYGNRMSIAASQGIFDDLRRMGVNVLIPEYPGYGMSEGVPSESECYGAADAALSYLSSRSDVDSDSIVVAGFSIGCGSAIDLSSRSRVSGLVLIVPLTNTREIGRDLMPWYLDWAVPLLARGAAFDNLAKLPRVRCPILMVRASHDQVTSSRRSDQLAAAATAPMESVQVESDHDGSWSAAKHEVGDWLSRTVALDGRRRPKAQPGATDNPDGAQ